MKFKKIVPILALGLVLSGCGQKVNQADKLQVYASFYPMYDFAKKIGGDYVDVHNMTPVGTEPHDYELTTKDIKNLNEADLLIYNGNDMEHWVSDVVKSLSNKKLEVVEASKGIELIRGGHHHHHDHESEHKHEEHHHEHESEHKHEEHKHEHSHDENANDPHTWLSLRLAKIELKNITDALVKKDEKHADYYKKNYEKYSKELSDLDSQYTEKLSKFAGKKIVVAHQAFGYMCKDYKLEQIAIEGLSPDSEPTAAKVKEIIEEVKEHNIKVIFYEELVDPKVANTIAKETGAKTDVLNTLEGLSEKDIKEGKDYISVMKSNLESLVKALQ